LYGHDRVLIFHGYLAVSAVLFAATHAILKYLYSGLEGTQILFGIISLSLFLTITVITGLFMIHGLPHRLRFINSLRTRAQHTWGFDYSRLKFVHNFLSVAAGLMAAHVLMASSTKENTNRIALIWTYGLTGIACYVYHKVIRPIVLWSRGLRLREVRSLTDTIVELSIAPVPQSFANARPGQFGYLRLLSSRCGLEEHPFTISSPPHSETVTMTIKDMGNYSHSLAKVGPGTRVLLDGPYGIFTPHICAGQQLFIAGGIGITPFLSIVRDMDKRKSLYRVTLVWSVRTDKDFVHEDTLREIAFRNKGFRYVPVVTAGEQGHHVDREQLYSLFEPEDFFKMQVFFCGPDSMRRALHSLLRKSGLPRGAFHFERFSF
jgi:predicted ferric reductase